MANNNSNIDGHNNNNNINKNNNINNDGNINNDCNINSINSMNSTNNITTTSVNRLWVCYFNYDSGNIPALILDLVPRNRFGYRYFWITVVGFVVEYDFVYLIVIKKNTVTITRYKVSKDFESDFSRISISFN